MPFVIQSALVLPPHRYDQSALAAAARRVLGTEDASDRLVRRFFRRMGVEERHLALPLESYAALDGFAGRNDAWTRAAMDLGERALREVLARSDLAPQAVDALFTTTVTGLAVPSLDARLMNRLPFRTDLRRVPLFGLGCLGGAAGVARAADYLRGAPESAALLLAVELCSLTLQKDDLSVANLISSGLFGDGAAAVLLVGDGHPLAGRGPEVVDSRSVFFPDTERAMGWDVVDGGFKVVLGPEVPELARTALPAAVADFLAHHHLGLDDVAAWIAHPGGPRIIEAMLEGLGLPHAALEPTRESLRRVGNLSSASVLAVLAEHLGPRRPSPGDHAILLAMGPAFCAELVLLRW